MDDGGIDEPSRVRAALDRYERPLLSYALRIVGGNDVERARDCVQETFAKLCDQPPDRVNGHLGPWLYTVCRNAALDVRRKARREMALVETADAAIEGLSSTTPSPAVVAEAKDATSHVLRMLARLPGDQQEVIRLKFQHQMSYLEISRITGHSQSNVGFLIHRGIKSIREMLS